MPGCEPDDRGISEWRLVACCKPYRDLLFYKELTRLRICASGTQLYRGI